MKKISFFIFTKSVGLYINLLGFLFPKKAAYLAYTVFSKPRLGKLTKASLPEILQEADIEIFKKDTNQITTYIWKGNETVILLVHGWESNASRWERILPHLRKSGSTIIAIDGPAHGLSDGTVFNVPIYAEFIDLVVQKYQPQYLIGHSIGGKACIYYQSIYQNPYIKKMVTLGAPSDFLVIINNYIALLSLNNTVSNALDAYYLKYLKLKIEDFNCRVFASKLTIKGLIAHDVDDKIVAFEEGKKIANAWKTASFIETKGLGHSLHDANLYNKVVHFLFEAE